jgi:hypothetical protein
VGIDDGVAPFDRSFGAVMCDDALPIGHFETLPINE